MITCRALFNALKVTKVTYYENSSTVEIFAVDLEESRTERYPNPFKFIYKSKWAKEMAKKTEVGLVVHIEAEPKAIKVPVFGIRGKPIHYPNGRVRETVKTRFRILGLWRGKKVGRWER